MSKQPRTGRPPTGREIKQTRSIRIVPSKRALIEEKYGSIQKGFDAWIESETEGLQEVEVVKRRPKEIISRDDF